MVDADDAERGSLSETLDLDGGRIKRCRLGVDGNCTGSSVGEALRDGTDGQRSGLTRAERVRSVGADVADDAQTAVRGLQHVHGDERLDRAAQVYAVYEDIALDDFLEGASRLGLFQVPLQDLLGRDAGLETHVDGSPTTAAESSDDDDLGHPPGLGLAFREDLLHMGDKSILVRVAFNARKRPVVGQLPSPGLDG